MPVFRCSLALAMVDILSERGFTAQQVKKFQENMMLRNTLLALLMLTVWRAEAAYGCNVKLQNDVIISAKSVEVIGANSRLKILPGGDVIRDEKKLSLSDAQRKLALRYQAALRTDLPWIEQGVRHRLAMTRSSLDKVIVQQLGSSSNARHRLVVLNDQLNQQMSRVIEKSSDGFIFHHKAIEQVEVDGRNLVQQSLGGILQDSLSEVDVKQVVGNNLGHNPLQLMLGKMAGLQQAVKTEWNKQQQGFQRFGHEVCDRAMRLEQQHKDLLRLLG